METFAAAILIGLTVALFLAARSLARDPDRWEPWLAERTWVRAMWWTALTTVASVVGAFLTGDTHLAGGLATVGAFVLFAASRVWALARAFNRRRD